MQNRLIEKHYGSVFNKETELLYAVLKIHNDGKPFELDPMYYKGNFYKDGIEKPKYRFDIKPFDDCEKGDATDLPFDSNSINSMIIDPPFMFGGHGKQDKYYSSVTHGFMSWKELKQLYISILKEANRILIPDGLLVFKCQDYTDNKTTMTHCLVYNWATIYYKFYAKDLAILYLPKGKISNNKLTQRHLRKHHSYFWIFKKKVN